MQRPVRIRGLPFTNKEKDMTTKIEWADMTINPVVGCSHCSPAAIIVMQKGSQRGWRGIPRRRKNIKAWLMKTGSGRAR